MTVRNVWAIFRAELPRLFANAISVIITIGLVVLPSLFSWYNILACWNVFDNTGNLKVAVANSDAGYESDLVPLRVNVGDQVVSALRANDLVRAGEHGSHATPAPDGAQDEAGAREAACEPTTEGAAHDGRKNPEGGDDRA